MLSQKLEIFATLPAASPHTVATTVRTVRHHGYRERNHQAAPAALLPRPRECCTSLPVSLARSPLASPHHAGSLTPQGRAEAIRFVMALACPEGWEDVYLETPRDMAALRATGRLAFGQVRAIAKLAHRLPCTLTRRIPRCAATDAAH